VSTAAGVDVKRGDQISVVAVEFAEDTRVAEGLDTGALMAQLIGLGFGLIKALTVLGVAFIVIWFGVRPLTRMLAEQKAEEEAGGALAAGGVAGAIGDGTVDEATAAILAAGRPANQEAPNLIEDLTSEIRNVSQKRLEQMVELDEEQAAAILKQWMRERAA
jgi:flagellar M-ring protein FliF